MLDIMRFTDDFTKNSKFSGRFKQEKLVVT